MREQTLKTSADRLAILDVEVVCDRNLCRANSDAVGSVGLYRFYQNFVMMRNWTYIACEGRWLPVKVLHTMMYLKTETCT